MTVSRRTLLKSIGLVGLSAALPYRQIRRAAAADLPALPARWNNEPLGRMVRSLDLRTEPHSEAPSLGLLPGDEVIRVRGTVTGQAFFQHNDLWLETPTGYVYSSYVQPMHYRLANTPLTNLGEGAWVEVTVPYSDAYRFIGDEASFVSRMVYGSTFRAVAYEEDSEGLGWYKIQEMYQHFYMRASHLRVMDASEFDPIDPDVPAGEKWLDVDVFNQILTAYNGDTPVMRTYTSTGRPGKGTTPGEYTVWDKRISERMVSSEQADIDDPESYNIPGVPFVCYFTSNWIAVHGCTWHNDYGQRRSAGCVNVTPEIARWVWRWSSPRADLNSLYDRPANGESGTQVVVHITTT